MIWVLAALAVLLGGAALLLMNSIASNGPRVVDRIDRLAGGSRDVIEVARASLGTSPSQTVALFRQEGAGGPQPVILFVHGGGWHSGSPDDYEWAARGLAPEGFVVALSGYRLYPEGRFPTMLEDTAAALRWVVDNAAEHGGDPSRIYLAGHSAGAYNVVQLALDPQWIEAAGVPQEAVAGAIGLAGPYDFAPFDTDSSRNSFGEAPDVAATQPIEFATRDAPPMLLVTGEDDTVVRPRNTRVLGAALERLGAPVETLFIPGYDHNRLVLGLAWPWRRDRTVIDAIVRFIAEPPQRGPIPVPSPSVAIQGSDR